MIDYLDNNLFESDDDFFFLLINESHIFFCDRVGLNEIIDLAESTNGKKCIVCHYWFFNHWYKF